MRGYIRVYDCENNISVQWTRYPITRLKIPFETGIAEANTINDKDWWITRVLVNPKSLRNKGIGSRILTRLCKEIRKKNYKSISVAPGGYDNDKSRQFKFYQKNGFRISTTSKELLLL